MTLTVSHIYSLHSFGPGVREMQQALESKGYSLSVDGDFGPDTDAAVHQFQRDNNLVVDGKAGPITLGLLFPHQAFQESLLHTHPSTDPWLENEGSRDLHAVQSVGGCNGTASSFLGGIGRAFSSSWTQAEMSGYTAANIGGGSSVFRLASVAGTGGGIATAAREFGGGAVGNAPIIIGENMDRVADYANKMGGETITDSIAEPDWTMDKNSIWINQMVSDGRRIIDIGPDFGRRALRIATGDNPVCDAYNLERLATCCYSGYEIAFTRTGKYSGNVNP